MKIERRNLIALTSKITPLTGEILLSEYIRFSLRFLRKSFKKIIGNKALFIHVTYIERKLRPKMCPKI